MVEEDVGELRQGQEVFCRSVQGSSQSQEGIVGRGEHGEGAFSGECSSEVGFDHGGFEQVVHVAVDNDIHDRSGLRLRWREQYGVDDVDHTVVGHDIGYGDLGVVDEDAIVIDGDGYVFSEEGGGGGAVAWRVAATEVRLSAAESALLI